MAGELGCGVDADEPSGGDFVDDEGVGDGTSGCEKTIVGTVARSSPVRSDWPAAERERERRDETAAEFLIAQLDLQTVAPRVWAE